MHATSAPAPRHDHDGMASVAASSVATGTGAANFPTAIYARAASTAAYATAAGRVALPALSVNSSSSSDSDNSDMIGGDGATLGRKSTGLTDFTDSPPASPTFTSEQDIFSANGDDVEDDMPTDAEASKYSFLDRLEHYMEQGLITEDNCKAVELAIMVEAGANVREMDPMKKETKEKAFLNSYVSIIQEIPDEHFEHGAVCPSNAPCL